MRRQGCLRGLATGVVLVLAAHGAAAIEPDWSDYRQLLQRYVAPRTLHGVAVNTVAYSTLKSDPLLATVVAGLESFDLERLAGAREQLAFYINAYNILAIKMVIDHWPVASIKDAGRLFSPVWGKPAGKLGGRTVTLAEIEDERLRPMGDPRIHMAIVCASVSCPDLHDEPYVATALDQQLDDQIRAFLGNPGKGLRLEGDDAHVSKIFQWFRTDFEADGGVAAFVRRYRELPDDAQLLPDIDYDWSLNGG